MIGLNQNKGGKLVSDKIKYEIHIVTVTLKRHPDAAVLVTGDFST